MRYHLSKMKVNRMLLVGLNALKCYQKTNIKMYFQDQYPGCRKHGGAVATQQEGSYSNRGVEVRTPGWRSPSVQRLHVIPVSVWVFSTVQRHAG